MARQSGPVYRYILKDSQTHPTCVVAGRNRHNAWLYVHAATPMVLRLHPPVVRFLLDALDELATLPVRSIVEIAPLYRSLPKDTEMSYPDCVIAGRNWRDAWLHVFAATPSAVRLVPRVVEFLREALADLPAAAAVPGNDARAPMPGPQWR